MKKRSFALAMAFVLALALTGCSAGREGHTAQPSRNVHDSDGARSSARPGADDKNDAFQGGGAGGTNDWNSDGLPSDTAGVDGRDSGRSDVGQAVDDIGRDAGDVVRDAGDAIGDAVDDVGRTMR